MKEIFRDMDKIVKVMDDAIEKLTATPEDEEELSECCGASIVWTDICSECKEHCL